jgi:putative ABC transport system substrate-binding protein
MKRRELITLLGIAAAWPQALLAQRRSPLPVVGFIHQGTPEPYAHLIADFQRGLAETGFVEGSSVLVEYRWAHAQYDRLPGLVAEVVHRNVNVIAAAGGPAVISAAKAATTEIPVVFSIGSDPVELGFVASLSRPGGNLTGISFLSTDLQAKQVELIVELLPRIDIVGFLVNPRFPYAAVDTQKVMEAARALARKIYVTNATIPGDFETALATLAQGHAGALLVHLDPAFFNNREQLTALVARRGIPAIYGLREFVAAGGLMSYGADLADIYRQHGIYVGRVLKGEKPADLPVGQATKFALVINLKVAKALGLTIPPSLLARADEVIE